MVTASVVMGLVSPSQAAPKRSAGGEADVGVYLGASRPAIAVGDEATFEIRVWNDGPNMATAVRLTDQVAGAGHVLDVTSSAAACEGTSPIVCSVHELAAGSVAVIEVRVRATALGSISNTADVTAAQHDPDLVRNRGIYELPVTADADLRSDSDVKTVTPAVFRHTIRNFGPLVATNVRVNVSVGGGGLLQPSQGTCTIEPDRPDRTWWQCNLGAMAVDSTAFVDVRPDPASVDRGIRGENMKVYVGQSATTGSVTSDQPDPYPENNVSSAWMWGSSFVVPTCSIRLCSFPGP